MKKFLLAILFLSMFPCFTMAAPADVDTSGQTVSSSCVDLSNNMRYRMRDANTNGEVSDLQDFLNAEGFLVSSPTGYFGVATLKAVKNYQSSVELSPTGYVGPLTRAKIKAKTCGESATINLAPLCTAVAGFDPTTGKSWSNETCAPLYATSTVTGTIGSSSISNISSNPHITVSSPAPTANINHAPIITHGGAFTSVQAGQSATFLFSATDVDNNDLYWAVNWGDNTNFNSNGGTVGNGNLTGVTCPTSVLGKNEMGRSFATDHTYAQAGDYTPTATVFASDCRGGIDSRSFTAIATSVASSKPTISRITTATGAAARAGDTIDVFGTNFIPQDEALIAASVLVPVNVISPTHLSFVVPSNIPMGTTILEIRIHKSDGLYTSSDVSNTVNLEVIL